MTVTSSTATALSVSDLIGVQDALEPRYQANSAWYGNLATHNTIDQLVTQASVTAARITDDQGNLLHRPYRETSDMASIAANAKVLVFGDLRQAYRIVDRIGMGVEILPLVLGANQRPIGARGLYAYWRVSAKVVNPAGVRVVKMHS